ncbi:MAG: septation protein SpoVG family protein [Candidatus Omnitrophica bacterium]|nr:septation protein SpoVG family protein [Candidatus Omnitrophota bacterium]
MRKESSLCHGWFAKITYGRISIRGSWTGEPRKNGLRVLAWRIIEERNRDEFMKIEDFRKFWSRLKEEENMDITEVKIILKEGPDKKLKAYATLTFDNCFVVRNVKVIKGNKGLFVAMPSRKMREACPKCNYKNVIRSKFCNQCGSNLPVSAVKEVNANQEVRQSEHRDIAHPITLECREYIQKKVLDAYEGEVKKSPVAGSHEADSKGLPAAGGSKVSEAIPQNKKGSDLEEFGDIEL